MTELHGLYALLRPTYRNVVSQVSLNFPGNHSRIPTFQNPSVRDPGKCYPLNHSDSEYLLPLLS
jgi:hypothetical protein